jgi:glycosyltransferase involved in cell wall biosynthesis
MNQLYYTIKPIVPWQVRMMVRRWLASRKRIRSAEVWPIMPGSERAPANWRGWPNGKQFALVLTHDIEGQSGLNKCSNLVGIEQQLGFRSSFNLIPEGSYKVTEKLRLELTRNGFEVGLHDLHHDGKLYRNRREFSEKAVRVNRYLRDWDAVGFRSAFMLHKLDWLHELNIQYDASTFDTDPFEPQPDGRHTIFPFWVPRREHGLDKAASGGGKDAAAPQHRSLSNGALGSGYVELPYTLPQDSTLFLLLREKGPELWIQKLDWIAANGGMALLNVHPDYLRFGGERCSARTYDHAFYRRFLEHVLSRYPNAFWNVTPRELACWFRDRFTTVDTAAPAELRSGDPDHANLQSRPLRGKRAAVVLYSYYESDPRPRRETQALLRTGMEVDVLCLRQDPLTPFETQMDGASVFQIPIRRRRKGKLIYAIQYTGFLLSCTFLLAYKGLSRRYHLVHVHNMPDYLVFSAVVPRLLGAKVILDLHDPMPELFRSIYGLKSEHWLVSTLKLLEKLSIRFAHCVVTPNIAFKKLFASRSCLPEKIEIVMNTPQTDIFYPVSLAESSCGGRRPFTLMYHGLLVERHGLDTAIRAIAHTLPKIPQMRLHLFGEPTPYMREMKRLIQELQLEDAVVYHGFKPLTDIAAAIREIDLGLIPNRRNPFTEINMPTRIFEYLAMKKPLIAPRTTGITDYFGEDEMLFFRPGDVGDLAACIERAYLHPEEVAKILARGYSVYEAHRWEGEEQKFLQRVECLLGIRGEKAIESGNSPSAACRGQSERCTPL